MADYPTATDAQGALSSGTNLNPAFTEPAHVEDECWVDIAPPAGSIHPNYVIPAIPCVKMALSQAGLAGAVANTALTVGAFNSVRRIWFQITAVSNPAPKLVLPTTGFFGIASGAFGSVSGAVGNVTVVSTSQNVSGVFGSTSGAAGVAQLGIVTANLIFDLRASQTNTAHTGPHLNSDTDVLTWHDLSGNGRDFTGHEFPTPPTTSNGWSTTKPYAYVCPGPPSGGSFGYPTVAPVNMTGDFTIERVVKTQRTGVALQVYNAVCAYTNAGNSYAYSLDALQDVDGGIRFILGNSPTTWVTWQGTHGPLNGQWAHLVISVISHVPHLYLNKVEQTWDLLNPTFSGTRQTVQVAGGYALHLGSGSSSASACPGSTGHTRMYSAGFSAADVARNFEAIRAEFGL